MSKAAEVRKIEHQADLEREASVALSCTRTLLPLLGPRLRLSRRGPRRRLPRQSPRLVRRQDERAIWGSKTRAIDRSAACFLQREQVEEARPPSQRPRPRRKRSRPRRKRARRAARQNEAVESIAQPAAEAQKAARELAARTEALKQAVRGREEDAERARAGESKTRNRTRAAARGRRPCSTSAWPKGGALRWGWGRGMLGECREG